MGRGTSKAGGGQDKFLNSLTDNTDFRAWIKENLKNPQFKQFGRENGMDDVKNLWYQKRAAEELKNIHQIPIEDAIAKTRESISSQTMSLWFREANSDIKPKLVDGIMSNPGTLNAGLNIAYHNYLASAENPMSFNKWATTPQTMYRGDRGQKTAKGDIFLSFTKDKKVAAGFTLGDSGSATGRVKDDFSNIDKSRMTTIKIRPVDTWGSYQTTAEQEFLVPIKKVKRK